MPSPDDYDAWSAIKNSGINRCPGRIWNAVRSPTGQRRLMLLATFAILTGVGSILLRVLRQHPESVHAYLRSGPEWLRYVAAFLVTFGVTLLVFRLLNPQWAHKDYLWSYPPGWVAWLAALITIAWLDLTRRLGRDGYQSELWEWLTYPTLSIACIALYRKLTADRDEEGEGESPAPKEDADAVEADRAASHGTEAEIGSDDEGPPRRSLRELAENWPAFEQWLEDDSPAEDDFIGNRRVAERLAHYLITHGDTVGLVGPFGSGKTSIVEWLKSHVDDVQAAQYPDHPEVWFCEVSCWGFEDTSAAITQILNKAVAAVGERVDCFSVRHLPETYRKTFSAAGDWVRTLMDLVLGAADPLAQFQTLSDILGAVGARLVVIIEDLDRASSSKFDQKEMAALLYRLKRTDNISFVLAADSALSSDIDFAKLCANIEQVQGFEPEDVAALLAAFRNRCQIAPEFAHVSLGVQPTPWARYGGGVYISEHEYITPTTAAVRLLRTPRRIKQVLSHTYRSWGVLHGEIDFDHLLAANMLRHGASQAFNFLMRHWEVLNKEPQKNSAGGENVLSAIQSRFWADWAKTVERVDWDSDAALALICYLLPMSGEYLRSGRGYHPMPVQGIGHKRYWDRAVNQYVETGHTKDQHVIVHIQQWIENPHPDAALVKALAKGGDYVNVFDHLSSTFFMHRSRTALDLAAHAFDALRKAPEKLIDDDEPPAALGAMRRLTLGKIEPAEVEDSRRWLAAQIETSVPVSGEFANVVYRHWTEAGSLFGRVEIQREMRERMIACARASWRTGGDFLKAFVSDKLYDLYRFVFPLREYDSGYIAPVEAFGWLGPVLLEALAAAPLPVARKIAHLIPVRQDGVRPGDRVYLTDHTILFAIFGSQSWELLATLSQIAATAGGHDKPMLDQLVKSGRENFWERCGLTSEAEQWHYHPRRCD